MKNANDKNLIIVYDCETKSFFYPDDIQEQLSGNFDMRPVWQIFKEDDVSTVAVADQIREKLETVIPVLESGLIYEILLHEHFTEDIESYRNMLGITQNYAYMMTVVYGDAQEGNHMTNAIGSSVKMQEYYQGVRAELKERFHAIVGSVMANKIAVLVPYEKPVMEYAERSLLIEKAREFVRDMRKRYSISFRVGISKVNELDKLSNAYNEAINSLIITAGSVAHADDLPIGCGYEEDYPLHIEKQLFEELEKGNLNHTIDSAKNFLKEVFEAMEEAKRISKDPNTKRYGSLSEALEDLDE